MHIKEIRARAIKDSRGEKTIEVSVNGCVASSPSGKSTGRYETKSYHETIDWNIRFLNALSITFPIESFKDLEKVEKHIMSVAKLHDVHDFGANALFALESAILKAVAAEQGKELWQVINQRAKTFPRPVGNAIGGGLHSSAFKKHPVFQEFLLIPREKRFSDNVRVMDEIYAKIGTLLHAKEVNDEGAWQAAIDNDHALQILSSFNKRIDIGVDIAASSFFDKPAYEYNGEGKTPSVHFSHLERLIKTYEVLYVEDPFEEEDFSNFALLKKTYREGMIVGDDLTVSHVDRLKKAIQERSINALIIKPNQNGSLVAIAALVSLCKKHSIKTVMSHRSGETMDDALADYAFGFQTDFIKCGIATPWRRAKLDRMIAIEKAIR